MNRHVARLTIVAQLLLLTVSSLTRGEPAPTPSGAPAPPATPPASTSSPARTPAPEPFTSPPATVPTATPVTLKETPPPPPQEVIAVEEGARIEPLTGQFCRLRGDPAFQLTGSGELLLAKNSVGASAELAMGDCAAPQVVILLGVGPFPRHQAAADVELDRGLVTLRGADLARRSLWWRVGTDSYTESSCPAVDQGGGTESCTLPVPLGALHAALPLGPAGLTVLRLPEGVPPPTQPFVLWDRHGVRTSLAALRVPITRFLLDDVPIASTPVEAWLAQSPIPIGWPGAVEAAGCEDGTCLVSQDGTQLMVTPPAEGTSLTVELQLRDGVFLRKGENLATEATVRLPLVRCRLRALVPALLAGVDDHRVPLEIGDNCPHNLRNLIAETSPATESVILSQSPDGRRVLVSLGHVPRGLPGLELRLLAGAAHVPIGEVAIPITDGYIGTRARLIDEDLGEIEAIPTNRPVRVELNVPTPSLATALVPVAHPGYYSVVATAPTPTIQGKTASGGTVSILVGYRPAEAGLAPDAPPLAVFPVEPGYQVRTTSVPVSLAPEDARANRLISVLCRGIDGNESRVTPGQTVSLPFESRHSCRMLIDQSALKPEDGPQRLRLTISVTHPDGTTAPGGFSKVLTLRARPDKESIWVEPSASIHPFDHVHVALAHDQSRPGDGVTADETSAGLTGQEETLIFGNTRLRVYGSAAIPTGLYRLTSGPDGGVVSFSAGALMRLALLNREGREFPVDVEWGLFGTGLAQAGANISIVAGLGLTVPILNANQPTQASVGIHAWMEYAPTAPGRFAQQVGFIFGPSVSIGDFGTNF